MFYLHNSYYCIIIAMPIIHVDTSQL